jgi:hypothetical protein
MFKKTLILATALGTLAACTSKQPVDPLPVLNPAGASPTAGDAALEANQVRKEYDACIKKYGVKNPACQELEWTYEDAKTQYDAAKKRAP